MSHVPSSASSVSGVHQQPVNETDHGAERTYHDQMYGESLQGEELMMGSDRELTVQWMSKTNETLYRYCVSIMILILH